MLQISGLFTKTKARKILQFLMQTAMKSAPAPRRAEHGEIYLRRKQNPMFCVIQKSRLKAEFAAHGLNQIYSKTEKSGFL